MVLEIHGDVLLGNPFFVVILLMWYPVPGKVHAAEPSAQSMLID